MRAHLSYMAPGRGGAFCQSGAPADALVDSLGGLGQEVLEEMWRSPW